MLLILLLNFFFAITFVLAKAVVVYIKPVFFTGIRMTIAGTGMLGYLYLFDRTYLRCDRKDWGKFIQVMVFNFFLSFCGEFWAIQYLTAAKVSLLFSLTPFITAFFAYILLSERLTRRQWVGLMIGVFGFIPILINQDVSEEMTQYIGFLSTPELVLLGVVAAASYAWIVTKLLLDRSYVPVMINGLGMLGGGIMSFLYSIPMEGWPPQLIISESFWYSLSMVIALLIALILLGNVICFNLYAALLKKYTTTFISFSGLTIPLFTAILDWIIWRQVVSIAFVVTMAIVGIGLYLFYQDELK